MNVDDDEVPKSVPATLIAFYIRSDIEAGHIVANRVHPAVSALFANTSELLLLSQLRTNPEIVELVRCGLCESALMKEKWYRELSLERLNLQ